MMKIGDKVVLTQEFIAEQPRKADREAMATATTGTIKEVYPCFYRVRWDTGGLTFEPVRALEAAFDKDAPAPAYCLVQKKLNSTLERAFVKLGKLSRKKLDTDAEISSIRGKLEKLNKTSAFNNKSINILKDEISVIQTNIVNLLVKGESE